MKFFNPLQLRSMRAMSLAALAVLVGLFLFFNAPPAGAEAPACAGANVLEEMRANRPELYQRLETMAARETNDNAILWRVEGESGKASYLFGTFHSTDKRVTSLELPVAAALNDSSVIAVEIADLSAAPVQAFMQKNPTMFFSINGPKLNTLLAEADYKVVSGLAQDGGMLDTMVPLLKPWFANISFFAMPPCEVARISSGMDVLDNQIVETAKKAGKRVVGLETLRDQYSAFASLAVEHQVTLLEDGIHNHKRLADYYMTSVEIYEQRKLGFLLPLSLAMARDEAKSKAALEAFKAILIDKRNEQMRDNALPLLEKGGAFIAVGALHLTGEAGLVALFRQAGYRVEKVL